MVRFIIVLLIYSSYQIILYSQPLQLDYELFDRALECEEEIETDVIRLTEYLVNDVESEEDRVKVIFFWIAQNIEYDLEAYYENIYFDDFQETLDRKRGICKNYSNLFKEMCTVANIECYEVSGYGKGYNFKKGEYFNKVNHSWNVVKVNNRYYLCDVTWGSGAFQSVDYGFEYEKKIRMNYFLQTPSRFIRDHLPSNPDWQLLKDKISMEEFVWNKFNFAELRKIENQIDDGFLIHYKTMDDSDQIIYNYEESIKYYYSDYISEIFGIYCYDMGYKLSINAKSKMDHLRAITYYEKSIEALTELIISYPKYRQTIQNANDGISYSKYRANE